MKIAKFMLNGTNNEMVDKRKHQGDTISSTKRSCTFIKEKEPNFLLHIFLHVSPSSVTLSLLIRAITGGPRNRNNFYVDRCFRLMKHKLNANGIQNLGKTCPAFGGIIHNTHAHSNTRTQAPTRTHIHIRTHTHLITTLFIV